MELGTGETLNERRAVRMPGFGGLLAFGTVGARGQEMSGLLVGDGFSGRLRGECRRDGFVGPLKLWPSKGTCNGRG